MEQICRWIGNNDHNLLGFPKTWNGFIDENQIEL